MVVPIPGGRYWHLEGVHTLAEAQAQLFYQDCETLMVVSDWSQCRTVRDLAICQLYKNRDNFGLADLLLNRYCFSRLKIIIVK